MVANGREPRRAYPNGYSAGRQWILKGAFPIPWTHGLEFALVALMFRPLLHFFLLCLAAHSCADSSGPKPIPIEDFKLEEGLHLSAVTVWPEYKAAHVSNLKNDGPMFAAKPAKRLQRKGVDADTRRRLVNEAKAQARSMIAALRTEWAELADKMVEGARELVQHGDLVIETTWAAEARSGGRPRFVVGFKIAGDTLLPLSLNVFSADRGMEMPLGEKEEWSSYGARLHERIFGHPVVGEATSPSMRDGKYLSVSWSPRWEGRVIPSRYLASFRVSRLKTIWCRTWTAGLTGKELRKVFSALSTHRPRFTCRQAAGVAVKEFLARKSSRTRLRPDPSGFKVWSATYVLVDPTSPFLFFRSQAHSHVQLFDASLWRRIRARGSVIGLWQVAIRPEKDFLRDVDAFVDPHSGRLLMLTDCRKPW